MTDNIKFKKCNIIICLIRRLSTTLPRNALLTTYKSFVRPHLDYGDVLYDKPNNENFQNKSGKAQYHVVNNIFKDQNTSSQLTHKIYLMQ